MHATRRYSHNVFVQRVSWEHLHALVFTREGMVARMELVLFLWRPSWRERARIVRTRPWLTI